MLSLHLGLHACNTVSYCDFAVGFLSATAILNISAQKAVFSMIYAKHLPTNLQLKYCTFVRDYAKFMLEFNTVARQL